MKKTISLATLAITASTSFAIIGPPTNVQTKTYCLPTYSTEDGSLFAGSCDSTSNNESSGAPLLENGCAESQVSLHTTKFSGETRFPIEIRSCLPPNVVQL